MATPQDLTAIIKKRLDVRLDNEAQATSLGELLEVAGKQLQSILVEGLAALVAEGDYHGTALCNLRVTTQDLPYERAGLHRTVRAPSFEIVLGDDVYQLVPKVNVGAAALEYSVAGRKGMFLVAYTQPLRVELLINGNARSFDVYHVLDFVGMLLTGK